MRDAYNLSHTFPGDWSVPDAQTARTTKGFFCQSPSNDSDDVKVLCIVCNGMRHSRAQDQWNGSFSFFLKKKDVCIWWIKLPLYENSLLKEAYVLVYIYILALFVLPNMECRNSVSVSSLNSRKMVLQVKPTLFFSYYFSRSRKKVHHAAIVWLTLSLREKLPEPAHSFVQGV